MKNFSLSNLSEKNLDKLQQSAINGGAGSCICGYICSGCRCFTSETGYEYTESMTSINEEESLIYVAEDILDPLPPVK